MTAPYYLLLLAAIAAPVPQESRPVDESSQPVAVPEPSPQAMEYYRSGNLLWIAWQATDLAIPALVLATGLSARMRNLARHIGRKWFFIVLVYFLFYSPAAMGLATSAGLLFRLRPSAYLRAVEPDLPEVAARYAPGRLCRAGFRRAADLVAVLADAAQSAAVVAVYGHPLAARDVLRDARRADLGGPLVQSLRPDARQATRGPNPGLGGRGRHRRRPRVRSR